MSYFYFLETALLPLEFPDKPDIGFDQLMSLYVENLSRKDFGMLTKLQKYIDLQNIRSFYLDYPLNTKGLLKKEELEKALEESEYFDDEIFDILNHCETKKDKINAFPRVLKCFFDKEIEKSSGFLKWFFEFEKNSKLILCAFRCKTMKRDVTEELSFEDPLDPVVSEIFSQKDSPHFEPPSGFEDLVEVLHVAKDQPKDQYHDFSEYRFRMIKQQIEMSTFTIEWLLGYILLFTLLEEYHNTNPDEGANTLNKMMKDT